MTRVEILVYDGVEVMDLGAPFELFSLAGTKIAPGTISVRVVGPTASVTCRNGLVIVPSGRLEASPSPDVIVVPGGTGIERIIDEDPATMNYVAKAAEHAEWVMAICSGSLLLAALGLLRNACATSHFSDLEALRRIEPTAQVEHGRRFVRHGRIVTSDGISAGLDASLYLISKLLGREVAAKTAEWAEYTSQAWERPD